MSEDPPSLGQNQVRSQTFQPTTIEESLLLGKSLVKLWGELILFFKNVQNQNFAKIMGEMTML